MAKHYVTLGQEHTHRINNITVDCDCIVSYEAIDAKDGREKAHKYFGIKFAFDYHDNEFKQENLKYFPRGIIEIDK